MQMTWPTPTAPVAIAATGATRWLADVQRADQAVKTLAEEFVDF
jgi:hypothetical protein